MRFLIVLTVLMLAVGAGVWWKTAHAEAPAPGALDADPNLGVAIFGAAPAVAPPPKPTPEAVPASFQSPAASAAVPPQETLAAAGAADAVASGSGKPPAGGGDPKEPQTAANEKPAADATTATATVQKGDTLYRIVLRAYGTAPKELVDAVARANGLEDAGAISPGQKIRLPSLAGWPAPAQH